MEKVAVAKTGPSLNEDVVIIILSKLPVKSLIRFKCVCKSWYSLIQSPFFITTHLNSNKVHHRDYLGLLMNDGVITSRQYLISFFSYNPIKFDMMKFSSKLILPFKFPRIIGSCNGLLCMVTETFEYYVLNPATREFKTLEQHEHWENLCYGFGFDPKANDYKLVRFTVDKTEVLTLKSNSWRPIIVMSDEDHSTSVMKGVRLVEYWSKAVLNNALHWVGESSVRKRKYSIIAFDLIHEKFRDMNVPGSCHDQDLHFQNYYSSTFQDCLSLCIASARSDKRISVEVWVMKEYGVERSWVKQYFIPTSNEFYPMMRRFEHIGVPMFSQLSWSIEDLMFNACTVSTKEFIAESFTFLLQFFSFVFNYRESLVPIDRKDDQFL